MVFPMNFAQAGWRHMGIDLGGADTGVAEEFLDDAQVGSVVEQVGGEAMTQHVRVTLRAMPARRARRLMRNHRVTCAKGVPRRVRNTLAGVRGVTS